MIQPKPYTAEECRQKLYAQLRATAKYWLNESRATTEAERMDGLLFSILNIFDGSTMGMPAMDIRLAPHPDDKQFLINRNERWFKPGMLINNCAMHEEWHASAKKI